MSTLYGLIGLFLAVAGFLAAAYLYGRKAGSDAANKVTAEKVAASLKAQDKAAAKSPSTVKGVIEQLEKGEF